MTGAASARALWGEPGFRRWVAAAAFARLPGAMAAFALLLAGHHATGSFANGAWLASAYAVGAALAAPSRGRRLDRVRLPDGLRHGLHWQAALLLGLTLAATLRAPMPVLVVLALLLGVMPAGVPGGFRAILATSVPAEQREAAFSLDAVVVELQWVVGPPIVGGLAAAGSPLLALGVMAASALLGSLLCLRLPEREPAPPTATREKGSVWRYRGMPGILTIGMVLGLSWGAVDAGLPPRLEEVGAGAAAWGLLAALLSAASAAGGLAATVLPRATGPSAVAWRARSLLLLWGVSLMPLLWASSLGGLSVWLTAAGFFLAPLSGTLTFLLQQALPPSRQAEGFSLYAACWALGLSGGNALAGALLDGHGARSVLAAAALVPVGAAVWAALLGTRYPAPAPEV